MNLDRTFFIGCSLAFSTFFATVACTAVETAPSSAAKKYSLVNRDPVRFLESLKWVVDQGDLSSLTQADTKSR
jgi:hypothetical protein